MGDRRVSQARIEGVDWPCGLSAWFWLDSEMWPISRLCFDLVFDTSLKCFQNDLGK